MANKKFDLISDLHLDFHVRINSNVLKMGSKIDAFVDSIIPDHPSEILVIAGDLGHYNHQNIMMLLSLKRFYTFIVIVCGNHDLYLVSNKQRKKYNKLSLNRWVEMKELASQIEGVVVLEGDTVSINGVTFGGTGMWYDYSYGIKEMNQTYKAMHELWLSEMNDNHLIYGVPKFEDELTKLERVLDQSHVDVIVTHVGPDWSKLQSNYQAGLTTSFYFFDGSKLLSRSSGRVWCFGHTHDHYAYEKDGCFLINNAIGYPNDNPGAKIQTMDLERFKRESN